MMAPGDIVPISFDSALVALSYFIAVLGSLVALMAAARIRRVGELGLRTGYIVLAAFALGGVGIWSMHFIGMQAQNFPFPLIFDYGRTIASLLVSVFFSGLALWFVAHSTFSTLRCLIGGVIAGAGVAAMHYIGVSALHIPADIMWSNSLLVLSVAIAIVAASAALWLAFNIASLRQRVLGAAIMGAAVCGMHYTGTLAGTFICTTPLARNVDGFSGMSLPYITFFLSAALLLAMRVQLWRTSKQYRADISARMDVLISPSDKRVW